MLTLKSPLKLHSIDPIQVKSNQLSEKISANYQLMSISVSSQDLLHMTTVEPEVYIGLEMGNNFVTENQIQQTNELKYEVVNQLLNRILLYQTPQFTYQDEVYVTTVLQKMGVLNIAEFMEQVRQNQIQNEQTVQLLRYYFDKEELLKEKTEKLLQKEQIRELIDAQETADITDENYFSNEIYYRLRTAESNNSIYDYHMQIHTGNSYQKEELSFIWQAWQADQIQISQLKQLVYQSFMTSAIWRENRYERKQIPPDQMTENYVLQQLAAAMLISLTQELSYEQIMQGEQKEYFWQDFRKALYHSTVDVIERFEEFHTGFETFEEEIYHNQVSLNQLRQEEISLLENVWYGIEEEKGEETEQFLQLFGQENYLELLQNQNIQQQYTENSRMLAVQFSPNHMVQKKQIDMVRMEELSKRGELLLEFQKNSQYEISQEMQKYETWMENSNITTQFMEHSWKKEFQWISIQRQQYFATKESFWEYLTHLKEHTQQLREFVERQKKQIEKGWSTTSQKSFYTEMIKDEEWKKLLIIREPELNLSKEECQSYMEELIRETKQLEEQLVRVMEPQYFENLMLKEQIHQWYVEEKKFYIPENRLEQNLSDNNFAGLSDMSVSAEDNQTLQFDMVQGEQGAIEDVHAPAYFETEEAYIQYLNEVNEKNLRIHQQILASQETAKEHRQQINLERKSAGKLALRALSEPEAVLKEIYEKGERIIQPLSPEVELLLQYTDEKTREFYRNILGEEQSRKTENTIEENYLEQIIKEASEPLKFENERIEEQVNNVETEHIDTLQELLFTSVLQTKNYERAVRISQRQENLLKKYETLVHELQKNVLLPETVLHTEWQRQTQNMGEIIAENSEVIHLNHQSNQRIQSKMTEDLRLIHHSTQQLSEEKMEEVRNSLRSELYQTKNDVDIVHSEQVIEKKFIETKQEIINTTQKNVTELIQQNLRTQIQSISEQVYQDIERRLNHERRRRGY